jgi:hypothetical protein
MQHSVPAWLHTNSRARTAAAVRNAPRMQLCSREPCTQLRVMHWPETSHNTQPPQCNQPAEFLGTSRRPTCPLLPGLIHAYSRLQRAPQLPLPHAAANCCYSLLLLRGARCGSSMLPSRCASRGIRGICVPAAAAYISRQPGTAASLQRAALTPRTGDG